MINVKLGYPPNIIDWDAFCGVLVYSEFGCILDSGRVDMSKVPPSTFYVKKEPILSALRCCTDSKLQLDT